MLSKRISALLLLAAICLSSLYIVVRGGVLRRQSLAGENIAQAANAFVSRNFPFGEELKQLATWFRLASGQREQNGVYITGGHLLDNIQEEDPSIGDENIHAITSFVETNKVPSYLMLIPTSAAIHQEEKPPYAPLTNQRRYIEDVYRSMRGRVSTVDVYQTLLNHREEGIYYKTESNLTGLGGYYVYSVLARRLGFEVNPMDWYEIQYSPGTYYGDLYQRAPYKKVAPDLLSFFRFSKYRREYRVLHCYPNEVKCYYTLYPTHLLASGDPYDSFLGGISPVVKISSTAPYDQRLLLFGDRTAASFLPFLCNRYNEITVVDLSGTTPQMIENLDIRQYDQIVFTYSVDTFMNDPSITNVLDAK